MQQLEFSTSKKELNRRKIAYVKLITSLICGLSIFSIILFSTILQLVLPFIIFVSVMLIVTKFVFDRHFEKYSHTKIYLGKDSLTRSFQNFRDEYLLKDIKGIRIKRTTSDSIRDIRITTSAGKTMYINGLEDFEQFAQSLADRLKDKVQIVETKEPIDYDHPLFYVFFGLSIGTIFPLLLKLMMFLSLQSIKYIQILIIFFLIIAGLFWIITKPMTRAYGKKSKLADYLVAAFMILAGIILGILAIVSL